MTDEQTEVEQSEGQPVLWPLTDERVAKIRTLRDQINETWDAIGEWTTKTEARQTGFSMHVRFENRVDVLKTTARWVNLMEQGPAMLLEAIGKLLAAHDERVELLDLLADLVDETDCSFDHDGNCQEHGWFTDKKPCPHGRTRELLAARSDNG